MKLRLFMRLVCLLSLWASPAVLAAAPAAKARPAGHRVDRIVAIVDDDIVTAFELEQKAASHMEALPPEADKQARRRARRAVLERALDEEITERLLQREVAANKDRLGVGDKDIDRAIDEVISANHIDREQLKAALFGQGMTMEAYRSKMREQIERARLMQFKVQAKVHVRDQDVARTCQERERLGADDGQVCAGHVLLALPQDPTAEERGNLLAKAQQVRERLLRGESLAKLAAQYSDDPASHDGTLGCFFRGEMVEAFEKAAFALQAGEVSNVVETQFGLHVIKVFEHRARPVSGCTTPSELEPFYNELFQLEMSRQMKLWTDELRHRTFVETKL